MAKPYEMKKDQTLAIGACRSCGTIHKEVKLHRLSKPAGVHTHWYNCSETGEPVMLALYETDDGYTEIAELLADKIVEGMEAKQFLVTVHTLQAAGTKQERIDHFFCPVNMPRKEYEIIHNATGEWMTNDRRENEGLQPGEEPRTPEPAGSLAPAVNIFGDGLPVPNEKVAAFLQGKDGPAELGFPYNMLVKWAKEYLGQAKMTAEAQTVFAIFQADGKLEIKDSTLSPVSVGTCEYYTRAAANSETTPEQLAEMLIPNEQAIPKFTESHPQAPTTPKTDDQTPIQKLMATPGVTVGEPEITRIPLRLNKLAAIDAKPDQTVKELPTSHRSPQTGDDVTILFPPKPPAREQATT
jgi:hypothetical protein